MPSIPVSSTTQPNTTVQRSMRDTVEQNSAQIEVLQKAGTSSDPASILVQAVTNGDTTHAPSGDAVFDALLALVVQTITNGDTTHAPSADAVFDALAAVSASISAILTATITNGDTTHAPTGDAVFDALALKAALASPTFTGDPKAPTPSPGDSDTSIATTAFVAAAITAAGITPTAWTAVSFTNSWVNFGSGYQTAQYRKNGDVVELRGLIKNGTLGSSAFTLPSGYRPPATCEFPTMMDPTTGARFIDIGTGGTVAPFGGTNANANLDGIAFSITT